jgi:4-hydroxy-L-threonine phosphate dehydrogenase PdxA
MKVTIEIKETNINSNALYSVTNYPNDGIYLNTDENGAKAYVMAIYSDNIVVFIGSHYQLKDVFKNLNPETIEAELTELKESENMVSESLALKMVALVINKEKFNDIN